MTANPLLIQQDPGAKYKQALAQSMAGQATSTAPVGHWTQALARMLQGYVGGKMAQSAAQDQQGRLSGAQDTLTQALAGYRGDVDTTIPIEAAGPVQPGMAPPTENYPVTLPGAGQNIDALVSVLAGNPDTANLASQMQLAQIEANMKPEQLQEVYDPSSPTGTRFVSRPSAVGQPGKPGSGIDIQYGPDGQLLRVSTGRKGTGGGGDLSKSTVNKIEEKQLNAQEAMARLDNIDQLYEPRFQQVPTRIGMQWTSLKAKFDAGEIDPKDMTDLYDYAMYRSTAVGHLNLVLKELSGAAVNEHEMIRLKAELPNVGTGIFDGDDYVTFQAKLDRAKLDTRRALVRYHYMTRLGKTGDDVFSIPLWKMDDIINDRGAELEQQYGSDEAGKMRIRQQLRQEFMM